MRHILRGFIECNLTEGFPEQAPRNVDTVLMLDVLEHLSSPKTFSKVKRTFQVSS